MKTKNKRDEAKKVFWQSVLMFPIVYLIEVAVSGSWRFGMFTYATIFIALFVLIIGAGKT